MSKRLSTFASMTTQETILLSALGICALAYIMYTEYRHHKLLNLFKQSHNMATFTDLQTASQALTTAASALQTSVSTYVAAHASDITAAQADTIVADINTATQALTAATASLAPTA